MALSTTLGPELPFLRRYARAVTGSQAMGDAAVRETLEALLEAPDEFNEANEPRVELYRIFHRLWKPTIVAELATNDPLEALAPRARHALFLSAVEGFSVAEVAEILDIPESDLAAEVEDARVAVAEQLRSDVLVIEDEAIIALHISSILKTIGHHVVGVARTHREAVELAQRENVELVLADISLADGSSGIDAVKEILADVEVPVIFVTAFPERLLTGERPEPTFLLTKPFEPIMLTTTIAQALMTHRRRLAEASETII